MSEWDKELAAAVKNVDYDKASFALFMGADPEVETENGNKVLIFAAMFGLGSFVRLLIDNKANVNAQDKHGNTPLIHAINKGAVGAIKMLLEADADVSIANDVNKTALDYAISSGLHIIEVMLREAGAKSSTRGETLLQKETARRQSRKEQKDRWGLGG